MTKSAGIVASVAWWWVLVVAPAVLTLAGVFGDVGPDWDADGSLVVLWVVFYLAQLAIVFVIGWAVGHVRLWWLLVASLLPFSVSWAAPYGVGVGVAAIAVAGAVAVAMAVLALRWVRLVEHGRPVTATVVRELPTRMTTVVNNIYVRRRVLLDIPTADGGSYQATLAMLYEIGTHPEPGDRIRLRVDPDNPKRFTPDPSSESVA